jgi:hypothetical protein
MAARGVVKQVLDTIKVSNEDRRNWLVQERMEAREESGSVMGRGMKAKKREGIHSDELSYPQADLLYSSR